MDAILRVHLITMADRLDHDREEPADLSFTAACRRTLADDVTGGYPQLLLEIIPEVTQPVTRAAYANRLRKIAGVR
jgi:hypothetical protein